MKRLLSLILAIAIFMSMGVFAEAKVLSEAENITYSIDEESNTIIISGKGAIPAGYLGYADGFMDGSLWEFGHVFVVEHMIIEEGITEIGAFAFAWFFPELKTVKLPETLERIGSCAFYWCEKLEIVNIPSGLKFLGASAFDHSPIKTLELPEGLEYLGGLYGLDIEELVIPESVENVPSIVACKELKKIVVKSKRLTDKYDGYDSGDEHFQLKLLADYCPKLEEIYILSPDYTFEPYVDRKSTSWGDHYEIREYLDGCPNATIYCYPGASKLINICKEEGISYCLIGEKPEKVSGIKVSANSESTVTLSWKASQNATDYIVQRYAPSKRRWITQGTTSDTTFTVDKCLLPGYVYKFRVRPVQNTDMGRVYGSYSDVFYGATKPEKVEGVKLSVKNRKLTVKWDSVERAKSYQVSYCTTKNGKYQPLKFSEKTSCSKYLEKGTYYVAVRARVKTPAGKYYYGRYSKIYKVNVK